MCVKCGPTICEDSLGRTDSLWWKRLEMVVDDNDVNTLYSLEARFYGLDLPAIDCGLLTYIALWPRIN